MRVGDGGGIENAKAVAEAGFHLAELAWALELLRRHWTDVTG